MERLQKVLAQAGAASRRKCEELIRNGRVRVDGEVCTVLGTKVDPRVQRIEVDGRPIVVEPKVCLMLHKPTSYVTTVADPQGRRTVMEFVKEVTQRVYPVGRLDYATSGLLLFTNDGELTHRLLHPSREIDKVYRATVIGMPDEETLARLAAGVDLEDGRTSPAHVQVLRLDVKESVLELTIHEGRHHQVRRMLETVGHPVKRLKRVKFGPLELGDMRPGEWRWLTEAEWMQIYGAVQLTPPPYPRDLAANSSGLRTPQRRRPARVWQADGVQSRDDNRHRQSQPRSRQRSGDDYPWRVRVR
ncbi:MAG: rRNA pseudouridine synthase [Alicyclobacillaceae bacterium]|nr:rRNA pseudouridine synthase [Alicyclobacillaceae bacterium]